jgi:hypothetical protein
MVRLPRMLAVETSFALVADMNQTQQTNRTTSMTGLSVTFAKLVIEIIVLVVVIIIIRGVGRIGGNLIHFNGGQGQHIVRD